MPRLIATTAFLALVVAAARDADACSCMESGPPCESFFQVQAVFAGTVRSVTPTPRVPQVMENIRVEFEDTIAWRGVEGKTQTVFTASDSAACGYAFRPGERYVVYAYRVKPGEPLRTGICSRTRRIAEAADDLLFFQSLSSATSRPRVLGSVTHTEPGLIYRDGQQHGAVAHVWLTLRRDTAIYNAATDAKGRYELTGVAPATYELTIEPPPGLTLYERANRTLTVGDGHSCAERNFTLRFDSRVGGSIRHATGGPAAGVRVQLMRLEYVDRSDPVDTIDTTTDATGGFEFRALTPGRYVLGVDLYRPYGMSPISDTVFRPTYHPGTPDASSATIIDIRGGEGHDLTHMTVPPPLRAHRLTGVATFADGTPAAGATVFLQDPVKKWMDLAEPIDTDASGTFSFVVHEGLSYIVSAYYRPPKTRVRPVMSTVGPFVIANEPALLEINVARAPER